MRVLIAGKKLIVVSTVLLGSTLLFVSCATRSPATSQIVNIPPKYSDKMSDELNATGFQQGLIVLDTFSQYNKVVVDVKQSDTTIKNSTLEKIKTGYLVYDDTEIRSTITNYAVDSYNSAFTNSPMFTLTDKPGANTLKVNVYITQVIPNDAVFGTFGNIPGVGWIIWKPIGMMIHYYGDSSGGAVAMETIVSDSQSGQILAVFASREKGTFALFNVDGFTMSGAGRRIIDTWSQDTVSTLEQLKSGSKNLAAAKIYPLINWIN